MSKKILFASLIVVAFLSIASVKSDFEIAKNIDIFTTVYRELNQNYVDELQPGELIQTAIDQMLETLDPYTVFIPESEIEDYRFMTTGQYGGIGALIQQQGENIVISEPYEGFPAQVNGLKAGDVIIEINGKSAKGRNSSEISEMLKGQPGSTVEIVYRRPGSAIDSKVSIQRQEIKVDDIPYFAMVDPKIGYVKLNSFTRNAGNEVKNAIVALREKNPEMSGLVLDLRGNGGGLLNEAVNIVNLFVDKGILVVKTKGKLSDSNKSYKTLNAPLDKNIALSVLIDENSASASEIVAGSIQDLDRGVIIGQKSYGKGLVQNIIPLIYNTQMKVTVAKYYIPSGRCIQKLDYSHKVKGHATTVKEEDKQTFFTMNGRPVKDAGGIIPDIPVGQDSLGKITVSLILKNHIFNYATIYAQKHPQIAEPEKFKLSNQEYEDFISYLSDKEYDYTTESEKKLNELIAASKEEKYYSLAETEITALQKKISHNKSEDLHLFAEEIKNILSNEIISRYYYQKGRIRFNLVDDKDLKQAIDVLKDRERYNQILKGNGKKK